MDGSQDLTSGLVRELTALDGVDAAVFHESPAGTVTLYVQTDRAAAALTADRLPPVHDLLRRYCTAVDCPDSEAELVVVGADPDLDPGDGDGADRAPLARRLTLDLLAEALETGLPGPEDNFLDLGGDSLAAIQVCSSLEEHLDITLPYIDIIADPVVSDIVALVVERTAERRRTTSHPDVAEISE